MVTARFQLIVPLPSQRHPNFKGNLRRSSFEPSYPKLFRGTPKVDLVSTVWRPGPSKNQETQIRATESKPFLDVFFFYKNIFSGQKFNFCLMHVDESYDWVNLRYPLISKCILRSGRFFITPWDGSGTVSWNLVFWTQFDLMWFERSKVLGKHIKQLNWLTAIHSSFILR